MKSVQVFQDFFHCDANTYRKRLRTFLEYTALPVVLIVVLLTVCMLLSIRNLMNSGLFIPAVQIISAVIFVFTLITRIMLEVSEHRIRNHSKYTYVEIGLRDIIVSLYAGSYTHWNDKTVLRRLLVIPLSELESATATEGKRGKILIKGKIRDYTGNSARLGYHFKDGTLFFNEFFYQETGFCALEEVFIPRRFRNAKKIVKSINFAKKRFDSLPPSKPYIFKEMAFVKNRKWFEKENRKRNF
jgi:hypothetical protein